VLCLPVAPPISTLPEYPTQKISVQKIQSHLSIPLGILKKWELMTLRKRMLEKNRKICVKSIDTEHKSGKVATARCCEKFIKND
jgi:hypothetical protein